MGKKSILSKGWNSLTNDVERQYPQVSNAPIPQKTEFNSTSQYKFFGGKPWNIENFY